MLIISLCVLPKPQVEFGEYNDLRPLAIRAHACSSRPVISDSVLRARGLPGDADHYSVTWPVNRPRTPLPSRPMENT